MAQARCFNQANQPILLLLLCLLINTVSAKTGYTLAKQQALSIYQTHPYTLFTNTPFQANGQLKTARLPLLKKKATQIVWHHVITVKRFGASRTCWQYPTCERRGGQLQKGRSCCRQQDATFAKMEADLHNMFPAVPGWTMQDWSDVPASAKGPIARAALYMHYQYSVPLSTDEWALMLSWHEDNPPDAWERQRHFAIQAKQGTTNPFIG